MSFVEKKISQKQIYQGPVFSVYREEVELPNGITAPRDRITHQGGAGIVALDEENCIYLVRQYRHGIGKELLEIPAGKLEPGEAPDTTIVRELEEEVGFTPKTLTSLGYMELSPAYLNEIIYLYLGQDLVPHKEAEDEDEFIEVVRMPFEEALQMVLRGELTDGKTQVAIMKTAVLLNRI